MNKCVIVFVVAILLVTASCLKKQNLDDDNLGPAINPLEVTKALGAGFGSYDYNEIKKNEFTSIILSQRLQDSLVQNIEQQGITVEASINSLDKLDLDLIVEDQIFSNGQSSQSSTRKWPIEIKKGTAAANAVKQRSGAQSPLLTFLMFDTLAFGSCVNSGTYPETCHQLKSTTIQYKVPLAAANQHNCSDIMNCYIPAKKIEFDIVRKYQKDQEGKPKRTHYTLVLSPEVPFLSRVLQLCSRGIYEITSSNQKILADICYTVNNYAAGQTPPPAP